MLDIAQGLTYLHDRNPRVIHRDVSRRIVPELYGPELIWFRAVQIFQHSHNQPRCLQGGRFRIGTGEEHNAKRDSIASRNGQLASSRTMES